MRRREFLKGGAAAVGGLGLAAAPVAKAATTAGESSEGGAAATTPQGFFRFPPGEPGRRSDVWVGVDVSAIAANVATVKRLAGDRPVMAVVKADAYGHGIAATVPAFAEAGIDTFLVTNTQEALAVREAAGEASVLHFGPAFGPAAELMIDNGIVQMIDSRDSISDLVATAAQRRARASVQVHIDTGLGRMGVPYREAGELIEYVGTRSRLQLTGVSTALTEDAEFDAVQLARFEEICEQAAAAGIDVGTRHVASSAALFDMPAAHLDMVRPGIALYGHYPSERAAREHADAALEPVLGLRARIAHVKTLQQGESVGYHRVYTAATEQTVAVLSIGYSDGYPAQAVASGAHVWIRGQRCPFVGEMTANHCVVRVPGDLGIQAGELAILIATGNEGGALGLEESGLSFGDPGGPPSAELVASWAGISVYRLLLSMNPLLPRSFEGQRRRR